jgi:hypothetical protein
VFYLSLTIQNITRPKGLSLKDLKPRSAAVPTSSEPIVSTPHPPAATEEDIAYSRIVKTYPHVGEFIKRFDFVSELTEEPLRRVGLPAATLLTDLAVKIIGPENSLTPGQIITDIRAETNVNQTRAEAGFNLMSQKNIIEATPAGTYYLTGSTPF